jgi:hypothetical protein
VQHKAEICWLFVIANLTTTRGGTMKFIVILLSILVFPTIGADEVLQRLISITDKQTFLQYKENVDWIEKSPKVTYISHDNRDAHGNGSFTTVTGYDCDRDGKVDDPPKCVILFELLQKHYQKH